MVPDAMENSQEIDGTGRTSNRIVDITPEGNKIIPQKGKAALSNIFVKRQNKFWDYVHSYYVILLRLPLSWFLFYMLCAPLLLSIIFVPIYFVDHRGMEFKDKFYTESEWMRRYEGTPVLVIFQILLYSLSISTTLGSDFAEMTTIYSLFTANLHTLCAQLLFVFVSGAVFHRLSQPMSSVRFAKLAIISDDVLAAAFDDDNEEKKNYKVFATRIILVGASQVLVDAKFEISVKMTIKVANQSSPFVTNHNLDLVRAEAPHLKYGLLLRHIIDEKSPLWGLNEQALKDRDAIFLVSVLALEESTLQPIFGVQMYSAFDGDVLYEHEFIDIARIDPGTGRFLVDQTRLSEVKPISRITFEATNGGNEKTGKEIPIKRKISRKNLNPGM